MRASRLVPIVLFAALLSAVPFHAALAASPPPPNLGAASSFAVLGHSAVTCTNPFAVTGDVGVDLSGAMTFFPCTIFGGTVYPAGSTFAANAYADFLAAYDALRPSTPPPDELWPCTYTYPVTTTTLGDTTFAPGVYCFPAALTVTNATFTLNGSPTDTWIFKIGTLGTGALTGTGFTVVMSSGATCSNNVFWWTAEAATLTDSNFQGTILAGAAISVTRGTFSGSAFAQAAVTLVGPGTLTGCGPGTGPPPLPTQPPAIKVTGGGEIPVPNPGSTGRATFGFNAQPDKKGGAKGELNYVNHVTGLHVNGPVTSIQVIAVLDGSPKTVLFSGTCGGSCVFSVTVEDHGEPGTDDQFGITVTGGPTEFTSQRVISNGNIQFHK